MALWHASNHGVTNHANHQSRQSRGQVLQNHIPIFSSCDFVIVDPVIVTILKDLTPGFHGNLIFKDSVSSFIFKLPNACVQWRRAERSDAVAIGWNALLGTKRIAADS